MKKKVFLLVSILMATPISIIGTSQAIASDCSVQNPCISRVFENPVQAPVAPANNDPGTWAVVDNSGIVRNIIVCQPSVCGRGGTLGGEINGDRLVQQTRTLSGQTTSPGHTVTENNGTFTVDILVPSRSETVTNSETNTQTVITVNRKEIFTFNVNSSENPVLVNNLQADVKAEEVLNNVVTKTETNIFTKRLLSDEIKQDLEDKNLVLLTSKINLLLSILGNWVK
jgi:hypothetical protein